MQLAVVLLSWKENTTENKSNNQECCQLSSKSNIWRSFSILAEFCRDEGQGMKNINELSDVLEATEDVFVAMNDVIPIFHVFSTVSDVQKGWEIESGSNVQEEWKWEEPGHSVLYDDGEKSEQKRKLEDQFFPHE